MCKYCEEITQEIECAIEYSLSNKEVCELVGISEETFYTWMTEYSEFSVRIKRAWAKKRELYLKNIQAAGIGEKKIVCTNCNQVFTVKLPKNWMALAWLAERTESEICSQKQKIGHLEFLKKSNMGAMNLQEMERLYIIDVLNSVEGNKSKAAKILNISRSTLREKLKVYQIPE